jgi:hypothetical protein
MTGYIGGIILVALGIAMIFLGKPRGGVTPSFLLSWPVGIAYIMTSMALLVFGIAWMIVGSG